MQRKLHHGRSILRRGDAFPVKVVYTTVNQSFAVTMPSQRKLCYGRSILRRDDAFPAKVAYGRSILRRDDAFPAKVVLRSSSPPPWRCIPSGSLVCRDDAFPAKVVLYGWARVALRSINPPPRWYNRSVSSSASTVQSYTVMMHSQRKLCYGRSILHRGDAFPGYKFEYDSNPSPWRNIPSGSLTLPWQCNPSV